MCVRFFAGNFVNFWQEWHKLSPITFLNFLRKFLFCVRPHGQLIEIYIYTQSFQSRKPQQKIYTHMLSLANINLCPHNNLGKFIYTPMPSKKIGRNLCVCTGMEPLSVTINFRQFLIGWVRIPYTHVKFPQFVMRDTCTELNPPTQLEFKENFMCVYGNRNLGCEYKISPFSDWSRFPCISIKFP
jgi:hypothetical protein